MKNEIQQTIAIIEKRHSFDSIILAEIAADKVKRENEIAELLKVTGCTNGTGKSPSLYKRFNIAETVNASVSIQSDIKSAPAASIAQTAAIVETPKTAIVERATITPQKVKECESILVDNFTPQRCQKTNVSLTRNVQGVQLNFCANCSFEYSKLFKR